MTPQGLPLIVLRHGPTAWNEAGRLQGRSDQPLSPAGRETVSAWQLDPALHDYRWITSPLRRARKTAALLGHPQAEVESGLIEMDWGAWEGETLADLRARLGSDMAAAEAKGLDFRPPEGESPRDVQARLIPLMATLAAEGEACVAVCHKGVIRALYALASGWNMTGKPPEKLLPSRAHSFTLDPQGQPSVSQLNIPLAPDPGI